ncbi:MAG TPA: zinc ribbon domain-containing protein [Phycisphaerae bacterium]|nr:zinc ribbon domain-containing protein [Phycisphaerae bacterium]
MPTYEYECQDCGQRFEKFQYITARPLRTCPDCGGKVRRLIGAGAAIISKGSSAPECNPSAARFCQDRPCRGRDGQCEMSRYCK